MTFKVFYLFGSIGDVPHFDCALPSPGDDSSAVIGDCYCCHFVYVSTRYLPTHLARLGGKCLDSLVTPTWKKNTVSINHSDSKKSSSQSLSDSARPQTKQVNYKPITDPIKNFEWLYRDSNPPPLMKSPGSYLFIDAISQITNKTKR